MRLLELCVAYFVCYMSSGVVAKWFLAHGVNDVELLTYTSSSSTLLCLALVVAFGWLPMNVSARRSLFGLVKVSQEEQYALLSGICWATILVTTILLYCLPVPIMVAVVVMRGAVILAGRVVDSVQSRFGLSRAHVRWEENIAVVLALLAVGMHLLLGRGFKLSGIEHGASVLMFYVVAHGLRIFLINRYINIRPAQQRPDLHGYFAMENVGAAVAFSIVGLVAYHAQALHLRSSTVEQFRHAINVAPELWPWLVIAGAIYGITSLLSFRLFALPGHTATYSVLLNRLISLVAGIAATLVVHLGGGPLPGRMDWLSLTLIIGALVLLSRRSPSGLRPAQVPRPGDPAGGVLAKN